MCVCVCVYMCVGVHVRISLCYVFTFIVPLLVLHTELLAAAAVTTVTMETCGVWREDEGGREGEERRAEGKKR